MSKRNKPQRKPQPIVETIPALCPRCHSTNRQKFAATEVRIIDGCRYTWRRTKCNDCGQLYKTRERVPLRPDE
jgi:transcriptional regulator NrdR family protein